MSSNVQYQSLDLPTNAVPIGSVCTTLYCSVHKLRRTLSLNFPLSLLDMSLSNNEVLALYSSVVCMDDLPAMLYTNVQPPSSMVKSQYTWKGLTPSSGCIQYTPFDVIPFTFNTWQSLPGLFSLEPSPAGTPIMEPAGWNSQLGCGTSLIVSNSSVFKARSNNMTSSMRP